MRVAFDGRSLSSKALRGWDRYTIGLARELRRDGVDIVLMHRSDDPPAAAHVRAIDCQTIGLPPGRFGYWEQLALPLALKRHGIDIYHAPAEHGVPFLSSCPAVLTIHSVTAPSYRDLLARGLLSGELHEYLGDAASVNGWRSAYYRRQIARAHHICTPSAFCRDEVVRFLGRRPQDVTVTPLAVDEEFLRPPTTGDERCSVLARLGVRTPYLLYVGGYEPHKNVRGLLEVFAHVRQQEPTLRLVLVGTKALPRDLLIAAEAAGLRPGVDAIFLLDAGNELTTLYDACEAFVSLSWRESFGLPALEAMTRGRPVIVSGWGAAKEVVGDAGLLVDPRDHKAAAAAILAALAPATRLRLSAAARRQSGRFSWAPTARRTREIYDALIARRS